MYYIGSKIGKERILIENELGNIILLICHTGGGSNVCKLRGDFHISRAGKPPHVFLWQNSTHLSVDF